MPTFEEFAKTPEFDRILRETIEPLIKTELLASMQAQIDGLKARVDALEKLRSP